MARNVVHQKHRKIENFTTAVFDVKPLKGDLRHTPEKSNPAYYFRPWKTVLARSISNGGESFYVCSNHNVTVPNLVKRLICY